MPYHPPLPPRLSPSIASLPDHRSHAGPALGPPSPGLEVSIRAHGLLEHLHEQRPHVGRRAALRSRRAHLRVSVFDACSGGAALHPATAPSSRSCRAWHVAVALLPDSTSNH